VNKGEILGLLGPNAAGKTTTMRILTCYMPPTSGKAVIAGYDIFKDSMAIRQNTGYLPENPPIYSDMSVMGYLEFVAKIKGIEAQKLKSEIDAVIEKTSIGDVQNRIISKLSKGYRQRVGLAQSLLNNPQIVILDEPTVGLDPKQIIEIRELIKNLAGEHTVILSSHILPEIEQTCERVVIINEGQVVAQDSVDNLTSRMRGGEQTNLLIEGSEEKIRASLSKMDTVKSFNIEKFDGGLFKINVESELDIRKDLSQQIIKNNLGLLELTAEKFTLEDIFLHLTTKEETV
jgi:ABC-2 type transport system ATP-binding protein